MFFLRFFVPDQENPKNPKVRAAIGRFAGLVGIGVNVLLFLGKLVVGLLAGSVAITADAMNNLSDATSSIVTLVGFRLSEKPADADHPYGHARFEYLAGLGVAAMIVVIGFELARTSVEKILHPAPVALSLPMGAVLVASILLKLWLTVFYRRLGRYIGSTTLLASATDSRNDVIATGAVLLEVLVEAVTHWQIDGCMGLAVALFILYSGAALAKETINPLLGEAASPELRQRIVEILCESPRVLGYHDLMVHDYGPGQQFASVHVEMDRREDPLACHELLDEMEHRCLREHNIHLVIHYDPVDTGNSQQDRLHKLVLELLQSRDPRLTLHDFRLREQGEPPELEFDISLPQDLWDRREALTRELTREIADREGRAYTLTITFDPVSD